MQRLTEAIRLILRTQSIIEDVDREMIDFDDKDMLRDCMDKLDNVKEVLEDLQI